MRFGTICFVTDSGLRRSFEKTSYSLSQTFRRRRTTFLPVTYLHNNKVLLTKQLTTSTLDLIDYASLHSIANRFWVRPGSPYMVVCCDDAGSPEESCRFFHTLSWNRLLLPGQPDSDRVPSSVPASSRRAFTALVFLDTSFMFLL